MEIQQAHVRLQKEYTSRRQALNVFEALHPDVTPVLFSAIKSDGEKVFVAEWEKLVAVISDVEYNVVIIEDLKEGIENAE